MRSRLVCSVGGPRANYQTVVYRLGDQTWATKYAPVAVAKLCELAGCPATVLVTEDARRSWYDELAEELHSVGMESEAVVIPDLRDELAVFEVLSILQETVHERDRVVLDVTYGLRHLPFVYIAALTYLSALRGVEIAGVFYGALGLGVPAPLLDITPLFRLIQWYHAIQTFVDSGSLRSIARELKQDVAQQFRANAGDYVLSRAKEPLRLLSNALHAGLPLEAGVYGRRLLDRLADISLDRPRAQPSHMALGSLVDQLRPLVVPGQVVTKDDIRLTSQELARLLAVAKWYSTRNDQPKALLLLREWLVCAVLLAWKQEEHWLEYPFRKQAADYMNALARRLRHGIAVSESGQRLASTWQSLRELRNRLAHAGFTKDTIKVNENSVQDLLEQCKAILTDSVSIGEPLSGARLLVTPLGLAPGVLYTAVSRLAPDEVMVLTSAQGVARVTEALTRAGGQDLPCQILLLDDPYAGFQEIDDLINSDLRQQLAGAGEVIINITGGTTLLQYVVELIGAEARSLGVPVRRVALVDRRTKEEQRINPYVAGEVIELAGVSARPDT